MDLSEFVRKLGSGWNMRCLTCSVVAPFQYLFVENRRISMIRRVDTPYFAYFDALSILGAHEVRVKVVESRLPVLFRKTSTV